MARRRNKKRPEEIPGQDSDGSFDCSDVPMTDEELEALERRAGAADDVDASDDPDEEIEVVEITDAEAAELIEQLRVQLEEAVAARQRAMADFVNYRRRATENEAQLRQLGVATIVRALIPALDNFDLALGQAPEDISVDQLLAGVKIVRDGLLRALETNEVRLIRPTPGEEFDPNVHQAVFRQPTDEYPSGSVAALMQVGYAVGEHVLRPASISVAVGPDEAEV